MSAARKYYPDEPAPDYAADEPPADTAWMDKVLVPKYPPLRLLDNVKSESVWMHSPPLSAVPPVMSSAQKRAEEEYAKNTSEELRFICKAMRNEWPDERIAPLRGVLKDTMNAIRLVLKTDTRTKASYKPAQFELIK